MPIVHETDVVVHQMHGATFHSFAAPASGSKELCAWRLELAGGTAGQPHQVSKEEVFVLLTGQLTVTLDGVSSTLTPGEVILVPPGSSLCIDNDAAEPATAWVTTSVGLQATMANGAVISPPWVC